MTDNLHNLFHNARTAFHRIHVRSALNPVLWLCGISSPVCLAFAYCFRSDIALRNLLVYIGIAPIVLACIAFIGFALFKVEKLQSEEYQLRHESLQIIKQQNQERGIPIDNLVAIANPMTERAIETGEPK